MQDSGNSGGAHDALQVVYDVVSGNLQLLAMLEVVHEWARADAMELTEAAERLASAVSALPAFDERAFEEASVRELRQLLERLHAKIERLQRLAPLQAENRALLETCQRALSALTQSVVIAQGSFSPRS